MKQNRPQSRPRRRRHVNRLCLTAAVMLVAAVAFALYAYFSLGGGEMILAALGGGGSSSARSSSSSAASSSQGLSSSDASQTSDSGSSSGAGSLLMLVNKDNLLPDGYSPDLSTVPVKYYSSSDKDNRFDSRAAPYLSQMMAAAASDGVKMVIVSGYRSRQYQVNNFSAKVSSFLKQGLASSAASSQAATLVAPPGTSEHESGLSADIVSSDWYTKNKDLTAAFDQTAAFRWLSAHAASYGFILRYPKGQESVTGYSYEPWHYRYVGRSNALKIDKSGLCLEKYLQKYGS